MGLRNQSRDYFGAGGSGEDSMARFEFADFELDRIYFRFAHVGWIGDDEVERVVFKSGEQVGLAKLNAGFELMAGGIGASNFERGGGDVGGMDFRLGQFFGKRECDATGACADVANFRKAGGQECPLHTSQLQDGFDYVLGFGARYEDRGTDDEVHAPKFLMAGNILRGNAACTLGECGFIATGFVRCKFAFGMRVKVGAVRIQREHE